MRGYYNNVEKMKKLLLVDGMNLYFQMFFGMPSRITGKDKKAIQGVLGFVGALIKIIKKVNPTHIAVIFDGEHGNDRTEILPEYKANRKDYGELPEDENPFSQLQDVYASLTFMGIKHKETENSEADDVIAAYAYTYQNHCEIVIASFDSDFFQLINKNVNVLRYRGEKTVICDTDYIKEKFNIAPCKYADFKSLTGDNSDNIKGAEGIGLKTASALINQFTDLEGVIECAGEIAKPSIRESVIKNTCRLRNNYKLIKLKNTAAVPFELNELKYEYNKITTMEVLKGVGLK